MTRALMSFDLKVMKALRNCYQTHFREILTVAYQLALQNVFPPQNVLPVRTIVFFPRVLHTWFVVGLVLSLQVLLSNWGPHPDLQPVSSFLVVENFS